MKIRTILSKIDLFKKIYRKIVYPKGYCESYFYEPLILEAHAYKARRFDELGEEIRLNLLVNTIDKEQIFGGISTAVSFFDNLAIELNVKKRIIVTDEMIYENDLHVFSNYTVHDISENSSDDLQILLYYKSKPAPFPVARGDIFISTAWWTAYDIYPVISWQAETYNMQIRQLIYLIQDFEPGFYQWSSRYVLAESTYNLNCPVIAVYNTKLLKDFFNEKGYKFDKEYYFEPSLNRNLLKYLETNKDVKKKKQILIYGRPSTPRNAFELIFTALKLWAEDQPDLNNWIVLSAGEKHLDLELSKGLKLKSLGKLTLEDYAKVMSETYIGISLMISPHPSYPPLEMSTFGIKTITNCYAHKDLANFNDNIVSLKRYSPDIIAQTMLNLCSDFTEDCKQGYNETYLNSKETFEEVVKYIKRDILISTIL